MSGKGVGGNLAAMDKFSTKFDGYSSKISIGMDASSDAALGFEHDDLMVRFS